jgi:hypothetical protein
MAEKKKGRRPKTSFEKEAEIESVLHFLDSETETNLWPRSASSSSTWWSCVLADFWQRGNKKIGKKSRPIIKDWTEIKKRKKSFFFSSFLLLFFEKQEKK